MNVEFANSYIPRRMADLGIGNNYYTRAKHVIVPAGQTLLVNAQSQFFILVDENPDVTIISDFGFYDLSYPSTNEQSYEHQGNIEITNNSTSTTHVRFIQVVPIN